MTLALKRVITPLLIMGPWLTAVFATNFAIAQPFAEYHASASQIATALENMSPGQLQPSRLGPNSASPRMPLQANVRPSLVQLKNASDSTAIFIENVGQFDPRVRYQARIGRHILWVTATGLVFDALRDESTEEQPSPDASVASASLLDLLSLQKQPGRARPESETAERLVFAEDFVAADRTRLEAKGPQSGSYNYLQSRDPSKWHSNVHGYSEVVYRDIWPGIDLRLYGNGSDLEQEFVVNPGGDLSRVQVAYRGVEKLNVGSDGSLDVGTRLGELHETAPRVYQQIEGRRVAVDGRFKLTGKWSYSFEVGSHDAQYALVVDPTLLYSTFLGGSAGYVCCYPGTSVVSQK